MQKLLLRLSWYFGYTKNSFEVLFKFYEAIAVVGMQPRQSSQAYQQQLQSLRFKTQYLAVVGMQPRQSSQAYQQQFSRCWYAAQAKQPSVPTIIAEPKI